MKLLKGLLLLLIIISFPALAEEEKKPDATQTHPLLKYIKSGKVEWLEAGGEKYLTIFESAKGRNKRGAVLLLPDMYSNPNAYDVIGPLRREFPQYGWATLSISLKPTAKKQEETKQQAFKLEATINDRINTALNYLKKAEYKKVIILGYGTGGLTAAAFAEKNPKAEGVIGIILLSANAPKDISAKEINAKLVNLKIPVLDLYASQDYHRVIKSAKQRRESSYKKAQSYQQRRISGTDYYYSQYDEIIIRLIRGWVKKNKLA